MHSSGGLGVIAEDDVCAMPTRHHPLEVALSLHLGLQSHQSPFHMLCDCEDLVFEILKHIPVLMPEHAETLGEAVDMAVCGATIIVQRGEHTVGARPDHNGECIPGHRDTAETTYVLRKDIHLVGEKGSMLRGMLVLDTNKGSIRGLKLQDAGDCCLKAQQGVWTIEGSFLLSGHAAAVRAEGSSVVRVTGCRLGGEGKLGHAVATEYDLPRTWIDTMGSVQEYGLRKNSCYGLFVKDEAAVFCTSSEIAYCSESAVFVRDNATCCIEESQLRSTDIAFTAGLGFGRSLAVKGCTVLCKRLWYDEDRPLHDVLEATSVTVEGVQTSQ
uniref:Right handed beta helix domain-containing protein n=1 Tax=Hemiselmis andersenii TaxID=464988 RepID=A0A6U4U8D6_HEMAN|eukprot:CAMPEP_0114122784 /NCGR_PEP_ID=MMETSP0043_2-20121206/7878_1 /TAXON_ID=464988 /ORGANISM="Hemiselmis andersenii, Strain CCMP644" /LENGTH=326 /DNA_ID=CAMNT_0001215519 /DNA_START=231 /DNA_END=1211 /DNA_ORIENTATION=+